MLAPLLHTWNLNLGYAKRLVADIGDDRMAFQPEPHMNHAAWVLGHLACTADMLGTMIGVQPACPPEWTSLFDWNSSPSSDGSRYPAKAVLLGTLEEAHARVAAALPGVPESRWSGTTPIEEVRGFLPT
ncbi:MAG: DinB family protein, partial [Planctomycetia bacterium]|nr:DinB family protein [Planctomycetia bacterium]